jgi:acetate kinase
MSDTPVPLSVLTFNSGSSSLKFGLYRVGEGDPIGLVTGEIETLGDRQCRLQASDATGKELIDETSEMADAAQGVSRIGAIFLAAKAPAPAAIGHRIVHGGPKLRRHCLIDDAVLATLHSAVAFAPLHMPPALSVIRYARQHFPGLPQAACFDTAFHADMPETASTLPLPAELRAQGIQRYGFHGLSCESIMRQLGSNMPDRVVIAHLGNGASITAVKAGRSIDTSMGLTPSGGIIMGTRTGDIDPGILLYLMREKHLDSAGLEKIIDHRSGLLGLSGISGDVRRLNVAKSSAPAARLALEMFRISVAKHIAGMIVALGGIDRLVFTGGIGENDAATRDGVVERLSYLGLEFDRRANRPDGCPRSTAKGQTAVGTLPSREDDEIARHTARLASATERCPSP